MPFSSKPVTPSLPRVFSISAGADFLPSLADALLGGELVAGFPARTGDLADAIIYLPTRRAARALAMLLAERTGGETVLLPTIVPLGEVDLLGLDIAAFRGGGDTLTELPPPIGAIERRLVLSQLVQRWSQSVDRSLIGLGPGIPFIVPSSPADAVALAGGLEALMDQFTTEDAPWSEIAEAVEADYSAYFKLTLEFVRIATESWPHILAERNASDPALRRKQLIEAETRRLIETRPTRPIIAAGSTGSIPATARLLAAISNLPNGAVVLPGLDTDLDDASWNMIGATGDDEADAVHGHPQTALHRLLSKFIRLPRSEVRSIGTVSPTLTARARLMSEVLRPAESTDLWATMPQQRRLELAEEGSSGIAIIQAADEREEALACAVALRETLATPGRTAALVTPDRGLARRVAAELLRWNIEVEDSAGTPLSQSLAGRLARLAAELAADFEPRALLALLAHPFVTFGMEREAVERAASALEIGVLRGPAPAPGINGLRRALKARRAEEPRYQPGPWRRIDDTVWDEAASLIDRIETSFAGFDREQFKGDINLAMLASLHRRTVESLSPLDVLGDGSQEALSALFDELEQTDGGIGVSGTFSDYPAFFNAFASERSIASPGHLTHRRLKILGLLEARLLSADRIVLGGLDESIWPPGVRTDAFLNRPMRARLGLAPPERRIGQTAHDFAQLIANDDVIITRAAKRDGAPMVPSRFLQRLKAFGGDTAWRAMTERGERYRKLSSMLEHMEPPRPLRRPAPKPPPACFPRSLSVTEIETLLRDPYAIFARHILKLDALEPLAVAPGAADRGNVVHDILAAFASAHPGALSDDPYGELIRLGEEGFAAIRAAFPQVHAEWWPRFERLARDFIAWEQERRGRIAKLFIEHSGRMTFPLKDGSNFTLRGRADRIEIDRTGGATVIDFKTGKPPGLREIFAGFAPQMTLEAAMLLEGAFPDISPPFDVPQLLYVHATGGRPAMEPRLVKPDKGETRSVADIVAEHRRRLEVKLNEFVTGQAAYVSRPFPKFARRYSSYDHLARVKEWSLTSGEDGGESE